MKRTYVVAGLAAVAVLAMVSTALGGPSLQSLVKQEVTAAGFKLDSESDVLRNPDDKRDWTTSPRAAGEKRGTSDRFVLKFVKP